MRTGLRHDAHVLRIVRDGDAHRVKDPAVRRLRVSSSRSENKWVSTRFPGFVGDLSFNETVNTKILSIQ